jgi:hypothetical protein
MALQCNIDSRGRAARLIYGLVLLAVGVVLVVRWAWPVGSTFAWLVSLLVSVGGAFAVFEARAGWCVIRAMGFKTPL